MKCIKKLIKVFSNFNLIWKLLVIYVVIIVLPFLFISYSYYNKIIENTMEEYYINFSNNNKLLSKNLQFHFNDMDNLINLIVFNQEVVDFIINNYQASTYNIIDDTNSEWNTVRSIQIIDSLLRSMVLMQPACLDIGIYTIKGQIYHVSKYNSPLNQSVKDNYRNSAWFNEALLKNGKKLYLGTHSQMQIKNGERVLTLLKLMKSTEFEDIGVVMIDYDYDIFKSAFNMITLNPEDNMIIADQNGNIVLEKDESNIGKGLDPQLKSLIYKEDKNKFSTFIENKRYFVATTSDKNTGWRFISLLAYSSIVEKLQFIKTIFISMIVLSILLLFLTYILIGSTILKPIKTLSKSMITASNGNLYIQVRQTRNDEIGSITKSFNILINSIRALLENEVITQKKLRDSEIKALQAQINPHFMYNTLNTIKWMAHEINAVQINKMISALIGLMKNSIYREGQLLPLRDELQNIRNFVYIQNIRYESKYELMILSDEASETLFILKMLLQPIVENAIFHGFIDDEITNCKLLINCTVDADMLKIKIADNGVGMDEEALSKLLLSNSSSRSSIGGIGVSNVIERIKLNYGDPFGVDVKSAPGAGTSVTLLLPINPT